MQRHADHGGCALVDWLATDPTGSGSDDVLIFSDLNAYASDPRPTVVVNDCNSGVPNDMLESGANFGDLVNGPSMTVARGPRIACSGT